VPPHLANAILKIKQKKKIIIITIIVRAKCSNPSTQEARVGGLRV
jgi:hypothetical protein